MFKTTGAGLAVLCDVTRATDGVAVIIPESPFKWLSSEAAEQLGRALIEAANSYRGRAQAHELSVNVSSGFQS